MKSPGHLLIRLLGGAVLFGFITMRNLTPTNVAATSLADPDPRLRTRYYPLRTDLRAMRQEVEEVISTLRTYGRRWRLVISGETSRADESVLVRAEVPVLFFTDDLEVSLRREAGENKAVVDVRSASRVGRSDLGENRRHVIKLLSALDERFER